MIHELKCAPRFFGAVADGRKQFEVRRDDREPSFAVGDVLWLREWDALWGGFCHRLPTADFGSSYTGRSVRRRVTYVLRHEHFPEGVPEGWVVMGLAREEGDDVEAGAAGAP